MQETGNLGRMWIHVQKSTPLFQSGAGTFKGEFQGCICRGNGLRTKQHTQLLKLVISGLISIILIVLSTVDLQLQGQFFAFFFLSPVLRILAAYIMVTVWSLYS